MEVKISFRKKRRFADMGAWRQYFESNRDNRLPIPWEQGVQIEGSHRDVLVRSLQRFQVGKSREGKHIKRWAAQTGNADYARSIELLMDEQNEHARLLALLLKQLGAPLLPVHWSDTCFILLRRFAGLETEIMTVLVAEVIAQRYFWTLYKRTGDAVLQALYAQILHDGENHIAFHCDYLREALQARSASQQSSRIVLWRFLFRVIAVLVALDHRPTLLYMQTRPARFVRECICLFDKTIADLCDRTTEPIAIRVQYNVR